jgi:hypothetical protein
MLDGSNKSSWKGAAVAIALTGTAILSFTAFATSSPAAPRASEMISANEAGYHFVARKSASTKRSRAAYRSDRRYRTMTKGRFYRQGSTGQGHSFPDIVRQRHVPYSQDLR